MRVVFYELEERWEQEFLERALPDDQLRFRSEPLRTDTAAAAVDAEVVSVFIHSRVDPPVLDRLPEVRLITTRSTGYDHIARDACVARGITVSTVPHYGENTVAEHAFGLILNLSRRIHQAQARTRAGDLSLDGLEGADLRGKTLGLIGAGAIGLHVARVGRAFGMRVLAYDTQPRPLIADVLDFEYVELETLLRTADVVSLHAPLLPETHHLMDRERFALMKRGSLFINTARGAIVDTEALLWALDEGIIAGAGLDVLEGEEALREEEYLFRTSASVEQLRHVIGGHLLLERDDVIVTPHMAWYSREARQRILETTVENIRTFAAGEPAHTVSEPER